MVEVIFQPEGKVARAEKGSKILDIATEAGVGIEGPCGGRGSCGKCRVIARGELSELADAERQRLSPEELEAGVRLACQTKVLGRATVEIPRTTRLLSQKILDEGVRREVRLCPEVRRRRIVLPNPSLEDQRADFRRLRDALGEDGEGLVADLDLLRELPQALRDKKFRATVLLADSEVLAIESGDGPDGCCGIAFDIGTTTVVGYLIDLTTGEQLGAAAAMNPQVVYGDDVISRIDYVIGQADGLETLHRRVVEEMNGIVEELAGRLSVYPEQICEATVVGNTCMHHLFLGIDPRHIAPNPFIPVISEPMKVRAGTIGLKIHPRGYVHALPNISAYVGADIVGGTLASDLANSDAPRLLVDIGTNGEIVLGSREGLVACSAAAGPAFEGARISCGMRGAAGAIDRAVFDEDVVYTTIDGAKVRGVCGSGLLDLAAELLRVGIVDCAGRMLPPDELGSDIGDRLRGRIVEGESGYDFRIADPEETEDGKPMYLTQRDIRELQLAKGAICTGIELLMKEAGVSSEDLEEIMLAGAFGNYLRKESALAIGLLPSVPVGKIRSIGNAAGEGAKLALISTEERERAAEIARQVRYIELGTQAAFMDAFTENMLFPMDGA